MASAGYNRWDQRGDRAVKVPWLGNASSVLVYENFIGGGELLGYGDSALRRAFIWVQGAGGLCRFSFWFRGLVRFGVLLFGFWGPACLAMLSFGFRGLVRFSALS